jgi:hypothetical protein
VIPPFRHTATRFDTGVDAFVVAGEANMAKLLASDLAFDPCDRPSKPWVQTRGTSGKACLKFISTRGCTGPGRLATNLHSTSLPNMCWACQHKPKPVISGCNRIAPVTIGGGWSEPADPTSVTLAFARNQTAAVVSERCARDQPPKGCHLRDGIAEAVGPWSSMTRSSSVRRDTDVRLRPPNRKPREGGAVARWAPPTRRVTGEGSARPVKTARGVITFIVLATTFR